LLPLVGEGPGSRSALFQIVIYLTDSGERIVLKKLATRRLSSTKGRCPMKPLIELSTEQYGALLKGAAETSPLHARLKNGVKTHAETIAILCDLDEAEILRHVAKQFCPDAVPQIENAIRVARRVAG